MATLDDKERSEKLLAGREKLAAFQKKRGKKKRKHEHKERKDHTQQAQGVNIPSDQSDIESLTYESDQGSVDDYDDEPYVALETTQTETVFNQLRLATERATTLEETISGKNSLIISLQKENEQLRARLNTRSQGGPETTNGKAGTELDIKLEDLYQQLLEKDSIISELTTKLEAVTENRSTLQAEYTKQAEQMAAQIKALQAQVQEAGALLKSQAGGHDLSTRALMEAQSEILALRELLLQRENEINTLQRVSRVSASEKQELSVQLDKLKQELSAYRVQNSNLQQQILSASLQPQQQYELSQVENNLREAIEEKYMLMKDIQELKDKCVHLESAQSECEEFRTANQELQSKIAEMVNQRETSDHEVKNLQNKIKELVESNSRQEQALSAYYSSKAEAELSEVNSELAGAKEEIRRLTEQLRDSQAQFGQLQVKADLISEMIKTQPDQGFNEGMVKNMIQELEHKFSEEISVLKDSNKKHVEQMQEQHFRQKVDLQEKYAMQLAKEKEMFTERMTALQERIKDFELQGLEADSKLAELNTSSQEGNAAVIKKVEQLVAEKESLLQDLANVSHTHEVAVQQLKEMASELTKTKQEKDMVNSQLKELQGQYNDIVASLNKQKELSDRLMVEQDNATQEKLNQQAEHAELKKQIFVLESQLNESKGENEKLNQELQISQSDLGEVQEKLDKSIADITEAQASKEVIQAELKDALASVEGYKKEIEMYISKMKEHNAEREELRKQLHDAVEIKKQVEEEMTKLNSRINDLEDQKQTVSGKLEKLQSQEERSTAELSESKNDLAKATELIEQLKQQIQEQAEEKAVLEKKVTAEIENMNKSYQADHKTILEEAEKKLQKEVEKFKEHVKQHTEELAEKDKTIELQASKYESLLADKEKLLEERDARLNEHVLRIQTMEANNNCELAERDKMFKNEVNSLELRLAEQQDLLKERDKTLQEKDMKLNELFGKRETETNEKDSKIVELEETLSGLTTQIKQKDSSLEEKIRQVENLEEKHSRESTERDAKIIELERTISHLNEQLEEKGSTVQETVLSIESLKAKYTSEITEKETNVTELENKLSDLNLQLQQKDSSLDETNQKMEIFEEKFARELSEKESKCTVLEKKVSELILQIQQKDIQVSETLSRLKTLEENYTKELAEKDRILETKVSDIEALVTDRGKLLEDIGGLAKEHADKLASLEVTFNKQLSEERNTFEEKVQDLEFQLENISQQLVEKETTITEQSHHLSDILENHSKELCDKERTHETATSALQSQISQISSERDAALQEKGALVKELTENHEKILKEKDNILREQEDKITELSHQNSQLLEKFDKQKCELEEKLSTLTESQSQVIVEKETYIKELETKLLAQTEDNRISRMSFEKKELELQDKVSSIENLEEKIAKMQSQHDEVLKTLENKLSETVAHHANLIETNEQTLKDLQEKHQSLLEERENQIMIHEKEKKRLVDEHAKVLAGKDLVIKELENWHTEHSEQHRSKLEDISKEYQETLAEKDTVITEKLEMVTELEQKVAELTEEARRSITEHQSVIDKLNTEHSALLDGYTTKIDGLEKQIQDKNAALENLAHTSKDQDGKVSQLEQQLAGLTAELKHLRDNVLEKDNRLKENDVLVKELQEKLSDMKNFSEGHLEMVNKLQLELSEVKKELEMQMSEQELTVHQIEGKLKAVQEERDSLKECYNHDVQALQDGINEMIKEKENLIKEHAEKLAAVKTEQDEENDRYRLKWETDQENFKMQIASLTAERDSIKTQYEQAVPTVQQQLQAHYEQYVQQIQQQHQQLLQSEAAKKEALHHELTVKSASMEELKSQLISAQEQASAEVAAKEAITNMLQEKESAICQLQSDLRAREEQLKEELSEKEAATSETKEKDSVIENLKVEFETLQQKQNNDLSAAQKQLNLELSRIETLNKELELKECTIDELKNNLSEMQTQLTAETKSKEWVAQSLEDKNKQFLQLQSDLTAVQNELEQEKSNHAETMQDIQTKVSALRDLQGLLDKTQQQLKSETSAREAADTAREENCRMLEQLQLQFTSIQSEFAESVQQRNSQETNLTELQSQLETLTSQLEEKSAEVLRLKSFEEGMNILKQVEQVNALQSAEQFQASGEHVMVDTVEIEAVSDIKLKSAVMLHGDGNLPDDEENQLNEDSVDGADVIPSEVPAERKDSGAVDAELPEVLQEKIKHLQQELDYVEESMNERHEMDLVRLESEFKIDMKEALANQKKSLEHEFDRQMKAFKKEQEVRFIQEVQHLRQEMLSGQQVSLTSFWSTSPGQLAEASRDELLQECKILTEAREGLLQQLDDAHRQQEILNEKLIALTTQNTSLQERAQPLQRFTGADGNDHEYDSEQNTLTQPGGMASTPEAPQQEQKIHTVRLSTSEPIYIQDISSDGIFVKDPPMLSPSGFIHSAPERLTLSETAAPSDSCSEGQRVMPNGQHAVESAVENDGGEWRIRYDELLKEHDQLKKLLPEHLMEDIISGQGETDTENLYYHIQELEKANETNRLKAEEYQLAYQALQNELIELKENIDHEPTVTSPDPHNSTAIGFAGDSLEASDLKWSTTLGMLKEKAELQLSPVSREQHADSIDWRDKYEVLHNEHEALQAQVSALGSEVSNTMIDKHDYWRAKYNSLMEENEVLRAKLGRLGLATEGYPEDDCIDFHASYDSLLLENERLKVIMEEQENAEQKVHPSSVLSHEYSEALKRIKTLQIELCVARDKIKQIEGMEQSSLANSNDDPAFTERLEGLIKENQLYQTDIQKLEAKCRQLEQLKEKLQPLLQASGEGGQAFVDLRSKYCAVVEENNSLHEQLEGFRERSASDVDRLESENSLLERENDDLQQIIKEMKEKSERLIDDAIENKEKLKKEAEQEIGDLKHQISQMQTKLFELEDEHTSLLREHSDLSFSFDQDMESSNQDFKTLKHQHDSLLKEHKQLKLVFDSERETAEKEMFGLHDQIEALKREHAAQLYAFEDEKERLFQTISELEEQLSAAGREKEEFEELLLEEKQKWEGNIRELRELYDGSLDEITALKNSSALEIQCLENKVSELKLRLLSHGSASPSPERETEYVTNKLQVQNIAAQTDVCDTLQPLQSSGEAFLDKILIMLEGEVNTSSLEDVLKVIQQLQNNSKSKSRHISELEEELAEKSNKIAELNTDIALLTNHADELQKKLESKGLLSTSRTSVSTEGMSSGLEDDVFEPVLDSTMTDTQTEMLVAWQQKCEELMARVHELEQQLHDTHIHTDRELAAHDLNKSGESGGSDDTAVQGSSLFDRDMNHESSEVENSSEVFISQLNQMMKEDDEDDDDIEDEDNDALLDMIKDLKRSNKDKSELLRKIQAELESRDRKIDELEEEIETLTVDNHELETELHLFKQLGAETNDGSPSAIDWEAQCKKALGDLQSLQWKVGPKGEFLEETQNKLEEAEGKLKDITVQEEAREKAVKEVQELYGLCDGMTSELNSLRDQLNETLGMKRHLQSRLDEMENTFNERSNELVTTMEATVQERDKQKHKVTELEEMLAQMEDGYQDRLAQLQQLQTNHGHFQADVETRLEGMQKKIMQAEEEANMYRTRAKIIEEEKEAIKQELEDTQSEAGQREKEYKRKCSNMADEIVVQQTTMEEYIAKIDEINQLLENEKHLHNECKQQLNLIKSNSDKERNKLNMAVEDLHKEIEKIRNQSALREEELQSAKGSLQAQLIETLREKSQLKKAADHDILEMEKLEEDFYGMKAEFAAAMNEKETLKQENKVLTENSEQMSKDIQSLSEQVDTLTNNMHELNDELRMKESHIEHLTTEVQTAKETVASVYQVTISNVSESKRSSDAECMTDDILQFEEGSISVLKQERDEFEGKVGHLSQEVVTLSSQVENLKVNRAKKYENLKTLYEKSLNQIAEAVEENKTLRMHIVELETANEENEQKLQAIKEQMETSEHRTERMQSKHDDVSCQTSMSEEQTDTVEQEAKDPTQENTSKLQEISCKMNMHTLENANKKLQIENEELQERVVGLTRQLEESNRDLQEKLSTIQDDYSNLETRHDDLQVEKLEIESRLATQELQEVSNLESEKVTLQTKVLELQKIADAAKENELHFSEQLTRVSQQLVTTQHEKDEHEKHIQVLSEQCKSLQAQAVSLGKPESNSLDVGNYEREATLKQMKAVMARLEFTQERASAEYKESCERLEQANKEFEAAGNLVDSVEEEPVLLLQECSMELLKDRYNTLLAEVTSLNVTHKKDMASKNTDIIEKEKIITELRHEIQQAEAENEAVKDKLVEMERLVNSLTEENRIIGQTSSEVSKMTDNVAKDLEMNEVVERKEADVPNENIREQYHPVSMVCKSMNETMVDMSVQTVEQQVNAGTNTPINVLPQTSMKGESGVSISLNHESLVRVVRKMHLISEQNVTFETLYTIRSEIETLTGKQDFSDEESQSQKDLMDTRESVTVSADSNKNDKMGMTDEMTDINMTHEQENLKLKKEINSLLLENQCLAQEIQSRRQYIDSGQNVQLGVCLSNTNKSFTGTGEDSVLNATEGELYTSAREYLDTSVTSGEEDTETEHVEQKLKMKKAFHIAKCTDVPIKLEFMQTITTEEFRNKHTSRTSEKLNQEGPQRLIHSDCTVGEDSDVFFSFTRCSTSTDVTDGVKQGTSDSGSCVVIHQGSDQPDNIGQTDQDIVKCHETSTKYDSRVTAKAEHTEDLSKLPTEYYEMVNENQKLKESIIELEHKLSQYLLQEVCTEQSNSILDGTRPVCGRPDKEPQEAEQVSQPAQTTPTDDIPKPDEGAWDASVKTSLHKEIDDLQGKVRQGSVERGKLLRKIAKLNDEIKKLKAQLPSGKKGSSQRNIGETAEPSDSNPPVRDVDIAKSSAEMENAIEAYDQAHAPTQSTQVMAEQYQKHPKLGEELAEPSGVTPSGETELLDKVISQLQEDLQSKCQEVIDLRLKCDQLQQTVLTSKATIVEEQTRILQLEQENKCLRDMQDANSTSQVSELQAKLTAIMQELNESNSMYSTQVVSMKNYITELQGEKDKLLAEQVKYKELEELNTSLIKEIQALKFMVSELQTNTDRTMSQTEVASQLQDQNIISVSNKAFVHNETQTSQLSSECNMVVCDSSHQMAPQVDVQPDIDHNERNWKQKYESLLCKTENLKTHLSEQKQLAEQLDKDNQTRVMELESEISYLVRQRGELEDVVKKLEEKTKKIEILEQNYDKLENEKGLLEAEISNMYIVMEHEKQRLHQKLTETEEIVEAHKSAKFMVEQELRDRQFDYEETIAKLREENTKNESENSRIKQLLLQVDDIEKNLFDWKEKLRKEVEENEMLNLKIQHLERDKDLYETYTKNLEAELAVQRQLIDDTVREHKGAVRELADVKQELEFLQAERTIETSPEMEQQTDARSSWLGFGDDSRILLDLGPDQDGHKAYEMKHFQLIEDLGKLQSQLAQTKEMYEKQLSHLRDELEMERAKHSAPPGENTIATSVAFIELKDECSALKDKLGSLQETNKMLMEEKRSLQEHMHDQGRFLQELKQQLDQSSASVEIRDVVKREFVVMQTQQSDLMQRLTQVDACEQKIAKLDMENTALQEALKHQKGLTGEVVREKEHLQVELRQKDLELGRLRLDLESAGDQLEQKGRRIDELLKELKHFKAKLREAKDNEIKRSRQVKQEHSSLQEQVKQKDSQLLMYKEQNAELRRKEAMLRSKHLKEMAEIRSRIDQSSSSQFELLKSEAVRKHREAVEQLRQDLDHEYKRREMRLKERHTSDMASLQRRHHQQVDKFQNLMVRVGGGWDTLDHYLVTHDISKIVEIKRSAAESPGQDQDKSYLYVQGKYKSPGEGVKRTASYSNVYPRTPGESPRLCRSTYSRGNTPTMSRSASRIVSPTCQTPVTSRPSSRATSPSPVNRDLCPMCGARRSNLRSGITSPR